MTEKEEFDNMYEGIAKTRTTHSLQPPTGLVLSLFNELENQG